MQCRSGQPEFDPRVIRFNALFRDEGWDSEVVFLRRGNIGNADQGDYAREALFLPPSLVYPPFFVMPFILALFYLKSLRAIAKIRPQICVAHQLDTLPLALLARVCLPGMKVVFDNEDVYSLMVARVVPTLIQRIAHTIESSLAAKADLCIFPSAAMRDYALKSSGKSIVVPNLPEESFVGISRQEAKKQLGVENCFVIGHFGYLVSDRGIETLVTAVGNLVREGENVVCLMTSGGPLLDKLQAQVAALRISEEVRFIKRGARSRIPILLSACDASAILHTKKDPMNWLVNPNKLFESMTIGVPVIGPNFGEIARIVKDADCGLLVDPENVEAVAGAVRKLATDSDLRERLSENAIKAMRTEYAWTPFRKSLIQSFKSILSLK